MRDQAQTFEHLNCAVVGISFDDPADNAAFGDKHGFPFDLLSDTDRRIAADYEVLRPSDDPFADYPQRISYLIDPRGVIAKSYEVDDPAGHGAEVLADLRALQS